MIKSIHIFLQDYFGVNQDTSATIITTLLVFIVGFILTVLSRAILAYLKRRSTRLLILNFITNYCDQIENQSKGFAKSSEQFRFKDKSNYTMRIRAFTQLDLGNSQVFEAFFTGIENIVCKKESRNLKRKAFNKIWEILSSVEFWSKRSIDDLKLFNERNDNHQDLRNAAIDQHRRLFERVMIETQNQTTNSKDFFEYLTLYDKVISDYQKLPNLTFPKVAHENLVLPLRKLNSSYGKMGFLIALDLNDPLMTASHQYDNLENLLNEFRKLFLDRSWQFRGYRRYLQKSVAILK